MRQPCKTRPFFICNVSLPLLPGPLRFIASMLIFISMTCLVFITQALDGNFSFRHCFDYLVSKLVPSYYFRLVCKNFNDLRAPVPLQDLRPVVPESECKITPFPRHGKIFSKLFLTFFNTSPLNYP